jgi:A/G-specific adenine glycosylase
MSGHEFARRLLAWHVLHGRHDLPWQTDRSPYRIWISEVMLQQTQVGTVLPYFERFVASFPSVPALAAANLEDVLALWSGLGYYARARHLHVAAKLVCERYDGDLPSDFETLQTLPGIGRSTAAAILALASGRRHAILDGNVRRVLARHRGIDGWPGETAVAAELWGWAERFTPTTDVTRYTQAIMDLGATVCSRHTPQCASCPVSADCCAYLQGLTQELPKPRPRRSLPQREVVMALVRDPERRVLMERRSEQGIWGGLWSLPESADEQTCRGWLAERFGDSVHSIVPREPLMHVFTHFRLRITPLTAVVSSPPMRAMDGDRWLWYNGNIHNCGMPAPVRRLIQDIVGDKHDGANGELRETGF